MFPHCVLCDRNFRSKAVEHKMRVLISLTLLSETLLILRRTERDIIVNVYKSSSKILILVKFQEFFNFLENFSKNTQISIFMKIRPVGSELFNACGRTDRQP